MSKSVLEALGMSVGSSTEEEVAMKSLFPTNDPTRMLQMMTEIKPRTSSVLSVLGVIRRKFNSQVIKMFEEEYRYNQIAVDGKGNIRAAEVLVGARGPRDEGNQLPG